MDTIYIIAMANLQIQRAFNDHFDEFLNDIVNIFPDDMDVKSARNSITLLKKANPRVLIGIWNNYVSAKYSDEIEAGDISFFTDKDYTNDVVNTGSSEQVMDAIDRIRQPIKMMSDANQQKTMKYIQNLKKLLFLKLEHY